MLDIALFFKSISNYSYCIVKLSDIFPKYLTGSDIDIFCYDLENLSGEIIRTGHAYLDQGYSIEINYINGDKHIQLDFMYNDAIDLRFDLYEELPFYENISIKKALFESIVENRQTKSFELQTRNLNVYVPSKIDENLLRYIEYQEWYVKRPDKIKHINFILEQNVDTEISDFLRKLHHYTELPRVHHKFKEKPSPPSNSRLSKFERFLTKMAVKVIKSIIRVIKFVLNK